MDDLEKAILLVYEPGAADPGLRAQAMAFCEQAKSDPSALLRLCLDRLHRSPLVPVQFWCLQALHDAILLRYRSLPLADLPLLRSSLLSLASDHPLLPSSSPFLRNKLAQAIAALIRIEYPALWPSPFLQLVPRLPSADSLAVDMFARLLAALDDDLLSQDYPRSPDEAAAASRVKDSMRLQCVPQIARHWFDAVSLYHSSDPHLAAAALDTMRRYVPWIDITLVANDAFIPLLFDLILAPASPEQLRSAAAGCVLAIVSKRMEPHSKLALLRSLRVSRVFADPDLVVKLATLITRYASEALECYKRLGSEGIERSSSLELLEEALPSVLYVMQNCDEVDSGNVVDFLSDYVSTMKSPSQTQVVYLGQILEVIRVQICYDPTYRSNLDIPDKIGREEEDQMGERRKELFTLFRSVCRVAPDAVQLFIRNLLVNSIPSLEMNVEEVEATLTLFYRYGETVSEEVMRTGGGLLRELIPMLLSARFSCHSHRVVALVYLETVTRYMKFVHENVQYIPHLLAAFLDERGIHHQNLNVSQRASYLFMRAVKLLKAKFVPFLDKILQSLEDTVARFTSVDWTSKELKCSGSEDGSQTFEAIGLLIGVEDVSPEKQSEYLAALLNPLCQKIKALLLDAKAQVLEESSAKVVMLQQIIVALNALSKGFNERLVSGSRPAIGIMFKQTLEVVLQILVMFPNIKPLRNKITSFLHRMVDILGVSIFPCLPMALKRLLVENEPKDMVDFIVLINQLICKFNTSMGCLLEMIFPAIASRLFAILSSDAFPSGSGANTEELRELQELQQTLYTFLHVMATHDLSSVFLAPSCKGYLDTVMHLLLLASCSHKDMLLRKLCVQIFVKLIKDWCSNFSGEDKVPGFRRFIIEKFATECCLYSVLDKSFDFRDANTLVLFGEIVLAQKVMYEKFGDDFIIHFLSKGLPAVHCPRDLAEQYYQKLQGHDIKTLKSFCQSLIENLRQHQNGSLVFR
ncbi:exportin-T isoform X1 [Elaeis guineensis]|uniref:Exportin-T n=1 Tax=Elaeis guineensis var. tenera TaxID=51953 RepID=A0A6I9SA51_ELAGV|nr:exportin-T isoform X2 [Elaeis guineensis]XP_010939903.1 exportin-T isoform X2 [Elaeis guineensis]